MTVLEHHWPPPSIETPWQIRADYEATAQGFLYHEKEKTVPCFALPPPEGVVKEAMGSVEAHPPGAIIGGCPHDDFDVMMWCRSGHGWEYHEPNMAVCLGCRTVVDRDLTVVEYPDSYRAKRAVMVAAGYHRVTRRDEAGFAALLHVIWPHVSEMVGVGELAEALLLDPDEEPPGCAMRVLLAAPGSGVYGDGCFDWSLLLAALPGGGLEFTVIYRSEPRPVKGASKKLVRRCRSERGLPREVV